MESCPPWLLLVLHIKDVFFFPNFYKWFLQKTKLISGVRRFLKIRSRSEFSIFKTLEWIHMWIIGYFTNNSLKAPWQAFHYSRELFTLLAIKLYLIFSSPFMPILFHLSLNQTIPETRICSKSNYGKFLVSNHIKQIELIPCQKQKAEYLRVIWFSENIFGIKFYMKIWNSIFIPGFRAWKFMLINIWWKAKLFSVRVQC